MQTLNK